MPFIYSIAFEKKQKRLDDTKMSEVDALTMKRTRVEWPCTEEGSHAGLFDDL